jgi:hypothetical protein
MQLSGLAVTGLFSGLILCRRLAAEPPEPTATTTTSLLQQISDETRNLYRKSRHSMVLVQLPTPQWLDQYNRQQEFIRKWQAHLSPAVREQILEQQERQLNNLRKTPATLPDSSETGAIPTTGPAATQPMATQIQSNRPRVSLSLFAVGLLVDDQGHAVFPIYVDHKYLGTAPLPAMTGEGHVTTATFVGADVFTNLTVLQLKDHSGTPAALGHAPPQDGELTLMIARDGSARLVIWNNLHPEPGFAILPDASIAGFGFDRHFLGASTAKPIVDQLIQYGQVHRAKLGVMAMEVDRDDALRRQRPELGNSPAIHITAVQKGSPAETAGMRPDDFVLSIGDQPVGDAPTFAAVIATRSGNTSLKILRGDKTIELTVNLQPNQ